MPTRICLIIFFALLLSNAVAADDMAELDLRINLELSGAAAVDVFESFAALVSAEPSIDPDLVGEITIQLNNVSTRTTMNAVCEMLGCKWWIEDGSSLQLEGKTVDSH